MGGIDKVQEFYRFFKYPGMAHIDDVDSCTVAYSCEYYDYLEDWYLEDKAPDSLLVTRFNLTANATIDYRRYFPYPLTSKYNGTGIPKALADADNWVGVSVPASQQGIV
jgi:hypothetical protein